MTTHLPIPFLILLLPTLLSAPFPVLSVETVPPKSYIEKQCDATRYPTLCVQCLSTFANSTAHQTPEHLARIALSVSLYRARFTRSFLVKVAQELKSLRPSREHLVVQDCLEQLADGVNQLSRSILELRGLWRGRGEAYWHVRNIESWISAAQTDAYTCLDEFRGKKMSKLRATIKAKVMNVAETASNALALFQRFVAARYGAGLVFNRHP
ncbi:unnamed protein product [Linum tenue]|uniref:Pectinesterase inhibitor domain-containing protein n=1 Tax=Linum tenue TaxID=586396 RepID=A0AAV0I8B0_9ROSI|nr:unnamed protein product [Linum tenue]